MKLHVFFYLDCRPFSLLLAWNGDITGTDLSNCRSILAFSDAQQIRRLSDVFLGGHPWWHLRVAQPGAGLILPRIFPPSPAFGTLRERERSATETTISVIARLFLSNHRDGRFQSEANSTDQSGGILAKLFFFCTFLPETGMTENESKKNCSLAFESPTNNARR